MRVSKTDHPLDDVIITPALAESRQHRGTWPRNMRRCPTSPTRRRPDASGLLQRLADLAIELCGAGSAG